MWDIATDDAAQVVTVTVTLGGNVFGGAAPPAEHIELTHLVRGTIGGHSAAFGDVSGTVSMDGTINITLANVPGGVVTGGTNTGKLTGGTTITLDYTVTLASGGTAKGTVSMSRG